TPKTPPHRCTTPASPDHSLPPDSPAHPAASNSPHPPFPSSSCPHQTPPTIQIFPHPSQTPSHPQTAETASPSLPFCRSKTPAISPHAPASHKAAHPPTPSQIPRLESAPFP